jgi:urea carboxylase-associated protein 1
MSIPLVRQPLREETVAPAGHFAAELRAGQVLRVVDLEGQQVADLICFALADLEERLSIVNTISLNRHVYPRVGTVLWSERAQAMMTIIADTCGVHDLLAGACSRFTNERRYGVKDTPNCRDNLAAAVKPWGIAPREVPFNLNVFMNCPIGPDGCWSIQAPRSKAGDYIDLRAEMDVLVAFSNCPQIHNACNAFRRKPLGVLIYQFESSDRATAGQGRAGAPAGRGRTPGRCAARHSCRTPRWPPSAPPRCRPRAW